MALKDEITKAVGAHGLWKNRLIQAIDSGTSEFDPAAVGKDNQCEFGKWLYGDGAHFKGASYDKVRKLHADFHTEAANVLRLATAGHRPEAHKALERESTFTKTSAALTSAMMTWAKESG